MKHMREITDKERNQLVGELENLPGKMMRLKEGIQNLVVLWALSLLLYLVFWIGLAWLFDKLFNLQFGMGSSYDIWVVLFGALTSFIYAIYSTIKWIRSWEDLGAFLKADLDNGKVEELNISILESKCFQEPEHGGLIYFLRTSDEKVLTVYDHESQDLGVNGDDPENSQFKVKERLHLVKAPLSKITLLRSFSGKELDSGDILDLSVSPDKWPDQDSWCPVKWEDLESYYQNG